MRFIRTATPSGAAARIHPGWSRELCAHKYDGTADHDIIDGSAIASRSRSWSVSLWVKGGGSQGSDHFIWSEGNSGTTTPILGIATGATTGTLEWYWRDDALTNNTNQGSLVALDNTWHNAVMVFDANSVTWTGWVDGRKDSLSLGPPASTITTNVSTVGALRRTGAGTNLFAGSVAGVSLWTRALSPTEIAELASGAADPSALVADYSFVVSGGKLVNAGRVKLPAPTTSGTPLVDPAPSVRSYRPSPTRFFVPGVAAAGGATDVIGFNTTGTSSASFGMAGMTDTFALNVASKSTATFTPAGMTDTFAFPVASRSTVSFAPAGMIDVFAFNVLSSSAIGVGVFVPSSGSAPLFVDNFVHFQHLHR